MRVLLTGAGGHVGRTVFEGLREAYDWRLMYHRQPTGDPGLP